MYISNHACLRYAERILKITFALSEKDIYEVRKELQKVIFSQKHKKLYENRKAVFYLIGDLILIFKPSKKALLTVYPAKDNKLQLLDCLKAINLAGKRFERLRIDKNGKEKYLHPKQLSILESKTKPIAFIEVSKNGVRHNLSCCFNSIIKAQKFLDDYREYFRQIEWLSQKDFKHIAC